MAKSITPFRYFDSSPEVIRLVVLMYVKSAVRLSAAADGLPCSRLFRRSPPPMQHPPPHEIGQGRSADQMSLGVEGVVDDGGVGGEETLG